MQKRRFVLFRLGVTDRRGCCLHLLMDPKDLPLPIIVTVLWFIVFFRYRLNFSGIFAARPT